MIWKSQLQTKIALSTVEAEYSALSQCMRSLLPLNALLKEVAIAVRLPANAIATIKCTVFEDNNGALLLATNQKISNRTKYFLACIIRIILLLKLRGRVTVSWSWNVQLTSLDRVTLQVTAINA